MNHKTKSRDGAKKYNMKIKIEHSKTQLPQGHGTNITPNDAKDVNMLAMPLLF